MKNGKMKTEWKKYKLGNLCEITSSKRFHLSERAKTGIPFYCTKEILLKLKGETDFECDYIAEKFYEDIKSKFGVPQTDDLLLTTRGTVGYPYLYKQSDRFYFADGNLSWFKNFSKELDSHFLYYWFLSNEGKAKVDSIAKGTAQKAVPITGLGTLDILLPPLDTQQKIAGILSAYDDLIENNRRQIKLLEEAAQKLYKEWFVKLGFPGHENVKIVDGVPEGWKKVRAEDYFEVTIGKTPPRNETKWFSKGSVGKKWISIADMGNSGVFIFQTSENLTNEAVESKNVKIVPSNTVLLSFKLTVGRVSITTEEMTTNEAIAHFVTENKFIREYVYLYLKNFHYDSLGSTSAISTAINSKIVKAMSIIIPSESLLKKFSNFVSPYFDKIFNSQLSILNLQSARDKLLPRLMNGEFDF